ncbi:glycosyltransferase [Rhizobium sp. B21/90]|uniref:glycosyltransferase n=1 Tax=Rhizobium sp. B21/90 TaxID=2819993 RepID=UPI001C5B9733|nr:glycosyltransferase [Rhizobium sp. B21/90]QYA03982.1 glycosyltransferase [Rhizobium sp. B21/90]
MNKVPSQTDYDENYYRSHCGGLNYDRSEPHWSRFFGTIARHITNDLRPRTVFDAGCAKGFLVEELRKCHVEAFGRDYSEYAVGDMPQALQAFCEVGSIADPIDGTYDLVTCIEVLEHMPEEDGRRAIANLCKASDTILFSSSPDDFTEPTHLTVRPPLHWLKMFKQHGFGPRSDYDASYLCPWAIVLERRGTPVTDEELTAYATLVFTRMEQSRQMQRFHEDLAANLARVHDEAERRLQDAQAEHERHVLQKQKDLQEAQRGLQEAQRGLQEAQSEIAGLHNAISHLNTALSEQLMRHDEALDVMRRSTSWRLMAPYRLIGHQFRRALHVARVVPKLARSRGGYFALLRSARHVISKEGLLGIKRAWRRANDARNQALAEHGIILPSSDYKVWLQLYATLDDKARQHMKRQLARWKRPPLISVVMPVYNPDLPWLEAAIDSVRNQIYPKWQLCIADDCSTDSGVKEFLDRQSKKDKRIKVTYRSANGHISEASNSALELATGHWMALLDQDDLLSEDALFYVAKAIIDNPAAELVYSDEDKTEDGQRFSPYFKSDWNLELLRTHNMICHLGTYKIDRVRAIGGFRKGLEGSQDYDLVLRFCEGLTAANVVHIPRVLYHWRSHPNSTAQANANKSYAVVAGQKALEDHLRRIEVDGQVEILESAMYRVHYALPAELPLVSLIIPTRNGLDLLRQCVTSILEKTTYPAYEIVIIDNNSDDPQTLAYFRDIVANPKVRVERDEQVFNYSAINNRAVKLANGDYIALINNDIEVISPDWLSEMMSLATQKGVGAVGARLWYPDDRLQHGGVIIGLGGVAGHAHKLLKRGNPGYFRRAELPQDLSAVTAACLIVKKAIFEEVGGFNEVDLKVAFNDVDFCLKVLAAGYRNVWTPYADLYHHESATRGVEDTPEKVERFNREAGYMYKRWETQTKPDPAYNVNLTLNSEDFSLAWPPRNSGDPTLAS